MSGTQFCCEAGGSCVELTQREYTVCSEICAASSSISFSELKQRSAFHQEILSRILRRLEVHGLVQKLPSGGYQRPAAVAKGINDGNIMTLPIIQNCSRDGQ
jgi:hypothetical protein